MNNLKDHCKCGHARETHHDNKHDCLGIYCECKGYKLYSAPDEPPTPRVFPAVPALMDPWGDVADLPEYDPSDWADYGDGQLSADDEPCPPTLPMWPVGTP